MSFGIFVFVCTMFIDFITFADSNYPVDFLQDSCTCRGPHNKLRCEDHVLAPVTNGAGHVILSKDPNFSDHFYCQFKIQAPPGKEVVLNVNSFSLPKSKECNHFFLRIYDGIPSSVRQSSKEGICGNRTKKILITSTKNAITLYYFQKRDHHSKRREFNLTYTYVSHPLGAEKCDDSEFLCDNEACVDNSLICDGYDNCGDYSDELDLTVCGNYTHSDPFYGVVVGSIVGGVVIVGIVLVSLCSCGKSFSREPSSNSIEERAQEEETTHLQSTQNQDVDSSFFQHAWIRNIVSSTQTSNLNENTQNLSPIIDDRLKQSGMSEANDATSSPSKTRIKQTTPHAVERTNQTMPKSVLSQDGGCCSKYLDVESSSSLPPSYSQLFPESPSK